MWQVAALKHNEFDEKKKKLVNKQTKTPFYQFTWHLSKSKCISLPGLRKAPCRVGNF